MIVFVQAQATDEQRGDRGGALAQQEGVIIESWRYCDVQCSLDEAQRLFAGDPATLELLTETNIPTQFKVVPTEGTDVETLRPSSSTTSAGSRTCTRWSSPKTSST
jgi:cell division transport system permease protein